MSEPKVRPPVEVISELGNEISEGVGSVLHLGKGVKVIIKRDLEIAKAVQDAYIKGWKEYADKYKAPGNAPFIDDLLVMIVSMDLAPIVGGETDE